MNIQRFTIGCYLAGTDPANNAFDIVVEDPANTSVYGLKEMIASVIKTDLPSFQIMIYKVHVEQDNVSRVLEHPRTPLFPKSILSDHWTHEELLTGYIHAFVELPKSDLPKAPIQPEDETNKVAKLLEDTGHYCQTTRAFLIRVGATCSLQETDGRILNERPGDEAGLPIGFYHPVFGGFLTNLASHDPLPASLRILTRDLFGASQEVFQHENDREVAIKELLGSLMGESFSETGAKDGMITSRGGTCCVLMVIQNEIGSGGSDPSIQAATSYSKYWGSTTMDQVRIQSCCPSLLVSIAGPWMSILGAVFVDRPVVQPLTDFIWLSDNPQQPSRLDYVARVFHCVSLAREELKTYYRDLPLSNTGKQLKRFFPYVVSYPDSLGRQVHFSYTSRLTPGYGLKAIFQARTLDTEDPKDIVIKFVQTYCVEAHRLLADYNLAPRLLYDGSGSPNLGPGFSMIVMEFVSGVDLLHHISEPIPERARDDIKRALKVLHEGGFVFGDLRSPNVMLTKDANGKVTGGMLVDFDWCGRHGEGVYPTLMNREIDWPAGVEPEQLMDKSHDNVMLERLWLGR